MEGLAQSALLHCRTGHRSLKSMTKELGGSELPTGGSASLFYGEALRDVTVTPGSRSSSCDARCAWTDALFEDELRRSLGGSTDLLHVLPPTDVNYRL